MLEGIDVSMHQSAAQLAAWLPRSAFVIVKASDGLGYTDPSHATHVATARAAGKLVGHYHFAQPGSTQGLTPQADARSEADWFVAQADARPGEALILDYEPYAKPAAPGISPEWILAFADRVRELTGAPCWLYLDGNMGSKVMGEATAAQAARIRSLPLWKATYAASMGTTLGWPAVTAWQYTSSPIDRNHFYGSRSDWARLAIPTKEEPDMQLTDVVGKDANGKDVTLAQVVSRALYAYEQLVAGGYVQKALSGTSTSLSALRQAIAADQAGEPERVKKLLEEVSVDITVNLPGGTAAK